MWGCLFFNFPPPYNFGSFINFDLSTVRDYLLLGLTDLSRFDTYRTERSLDEGDYKLKVSRNIRRIYFIQP